MLGSSHPARGGAPIRGVRRASPPPSAPVRLLFAAALAALALPVSATPPAPLAPPASADTTEVPAQLTREARSFSLNRLLIPVEGIAPDDLKDSFTSPRSGGRVHRSIDIMAPRGTPVLAVADGEIARRTRNRLGGITLYLRSADGSHDFYYAHLSRYADGMSVGTEVRQGDVIGYVGTTGNARAPHLHFQVLRRDGSRGRGTPVNPYPLLRRSELHTDRETVRG